MYQLKRAPLSCAYVLTNIMIVKALVDILAETDIRIAILLAQ